MGCDIHMWAEIKREKKDGSTGWHQVGHVFKDLWHRPEDPTYFIGEDWEYNKAYSDQPYDCRNYSLFAILADVRNGKGFAGCDTGDGFVPIDQPRGVPGDASELFLRNVAKWNGDGHSHSWFTLAELEDYNWDQKTQHRGFVSLNEYKEYKKNGKPQSWCGGVSGNHTRIVSHETMDILIHASEETGFTYFTKVEWEESYRTSVQGFLDHAMPALRAISKQTAVIDVRIVFFFYN